MSLQEKTMLEKLKLASPYNIFYNTMPALSKQDNSIRFTDLLCPSLGEIQTSLQITFKVDIEWLITQYEQKHLTSKPLTILYSEENPDLETFVRNNLPNVKQHCVAVRDLQGSHHAKLSIFAYEDKSLRVVVSTANLYQDHWDHFNHCFWVSPLCRRLPENSETGDSPTNFKSDLLNYLKRYNLRILDTWIDYVQRADFSDVRVFLVTSLPGRHPIERPWSLLQQMESVLGKYCNVPCQKEWPVVIQTSCVGHYGKDSRNWLESTLLAKLQCDVYASAVPYQIIYPSVSDVEWGLFPEKSADSLRYLQAIYEGQKWLTRHLYAWKADTLGRSGIIYNCKTYCRVSPCCTKLGWFLLTTANATRGAWGQRRNDGIYVRNYEIGILFVPSFFDKEYFPLENNNNDTLKLFPMMYDLPLKKYEDYDEPWTTTNVTTFTQKCLYEPNSYEVL